MTAPIVLSDTSDASMLLPEGTAGIDAGLTLTKIARHIAGGVVFSACETSALLDGGADVGSIAPDAASIGITGARGDHVRDGTGVVRSQEIEAAVRGAIALLGANAPDAFVLALLGTGTAFAAVRDGAVQHLGGTAMGGGSFAAIARRIDPSLSYAETILRAAGGDRRNADLMVSDAYPDGIGRISSDLTAAHLAKGNASLDDFLAGLLNMHGESIAQIAAGRAQASGVRRIVLAGGFVHDNAALADSMTAMVRLFGMQLDVTPHPGFAGAIGAALIASREGD